VLNGALEPIFRPMCVELTVKKSTQSSYGGTAKDFFSEAKIFLLVFDGPKPIGIRTVQA